MTNQRSVNITIAQTLRYLEGLGYRRRTSSGSLVVYHPEHPERLPMSLGPNKREALNSNMARRIGRDLGLGNVQSVVAAIRRA